MAKINLIKKNKKEFFSMKYGMTFAEVLVTIAVFSIIMVGVNQLFIKSWQNYRFVMKTSEASIAANRGVSEIVRVLREATTASSGAYALLGVSSFDLKFFSNIDDDSDIEKIHYFLNGTNLMMGKSDPSGSPLVYPAGDSEVSVLIKNVVNTSSQPLFHYYDGRNNLISSPSDSIGDIRMVEIDLVVDRQDNDMNIESYASMRNLSDYDTIK